jgi:hypothetical protein
MRRLRSDPRSLEERMADQAGKLKDEALLLPPGNAMRF